MSTLSQFAPFAGGGIKSIQTGYINATATSGTAGDQDERYIDTTISSVNTSKAVSDVFGTASGSSNAAGYFFFGTSERTSSLRPRLTSATNLRISTYGTNQGGTPTILCRWYVIESN